MNQRLKLLASLAGLMACVDIGDGSAPPVEPKCPASELVERYPDGDLDGYGAEGSALVTVCASEHGFSTRSDDCDDANVYVHPERDDICNDMDDDCDDEVDEDPDDVVYLDADGDGYGAGFRVEACVGDEGVVGNKDDCDDTNPEVSPDALEVCGNGVDDDCSGRKDCRDSACYDPTCDEICWDGGDNDQDGLVDCEDGDCFAESICEGLERWDMQVLGGSFRRVSYDPMAAVYRTTNGGYADNIRLSWTVSGVNGRGSFPVSSGTTIRTSCAWDLGWGHREAACGRGLYSCADPTAWLRMRLVTTTGFAWSSACPIVELPTFRELVPPFLYWPHRPEGATSSVRMETYPAWGNSPLRWYIGLEEGRSFRSDRTTLSNGDWYWDRTMSTWGTLTTGDLQVDLIGP